MAGIIGYSVYVPMYRLKQLDAATPWSNFAMGEKAVCGADEDVVTMAVAAAQKAIQHAGVDPTKIEALHLATASSPYIEQYLSPIIAETLDVGPEATIQDFCGSLNSMSMALLACLDAIAAGRIKCGLIIGTENRRTHPGTDGELNFGAGAAALVVGTEGTIVDIEDIHNYSTLFHDRWRVDSENRVNNSVGDRVNYECHVTNEFDGRFDREYGYQKHIDEALKGVMQKVGKKPDDYNHVVVPQPAANLPKLVAKDLGIKQGMAPTTTVQALGDLGSVSSYVILGGVLDNAQAGEKILLASYGSGSSTGVSMTVTDKIEAKRSQVKPLQKQIERKQYISYVDYLKIAENIIRAPY